MNIFLILAQFVNLLFVLVMVRIVLSWLNPRAMFYPSNPFLKLLFNLTEPMVKPIQNLIPPVGAFDFSYTILLMGLGFLSQVLRMFA